MLQLTDWMARLMKQSVRECWPSVTVLFALIDLLHAMTGCCSLRLVASLLAWLPSRRFRAELSAPSPSYVHTSFRSDRHAVPCCLVECASTRARFQCPNPCHLPNLTAADIPRDPRTCPVTCFDGFVQNITSFFVLFWYCLCFRESLFMFLLSITVYLSIWIKKGFVYMRFWRVYLLITEFDCPEWPCAVDRTLKSNY